MWDDARRRLGQNFSLLAAASVLAMCCCQVEISAEAGDDPTSKMLIDIDSLAKCLGGEDLRILDVRPQEEYGSGHVPGAVSVPLEAWQEFSHQPGALHDTKAWAEKIGALGVGSDSQVVIYGGKLNEAARVWWLLKYLGHERVRLLDGDWQTWVSQQRPVETEVVSPKPAQFVPNLQEERLAEIDQVKKRLGDPGVVVIDSRTRDEYTGKEVPKGNPRGGHLPGAVNLNWEELRAEDGRFKPPKELRAIYATHGITPGQTLIVHCQSGGRSAAQAFALELTGLGKARNYYCSFREWSSDKDAPVAEGEGD